MLTTASGGAASRQALAQMQHCMSVDIFCTSQVVIVIYIVQCKFFEVAQWTLVENAAELQIKMFVSCF